MFVLIRRFSSATLLAFFLLWPQPVNAVENGDAQATHTYSLGIVHGEQTFACVYIAPSRDEPGLVKIRVSFFAQASDRRTIYSKSTPKLSGSSPVPIISVFPNTVEMKAVDLLHRGHKQLFLTGTMGAIYTYVYDYDGTNVRSFYKPTGGRVEVMPVWTRRHGWILEEHWARYHYRDEDNLGTGHDLGNNDVMRRMYWNGQHFVPEQPGETRIVDRNGHQENLKKHIAYTTTKQSVVLQKPPQYWTRIANNSHYSRVHRRQTVFQLLKQFLHVGMPLSELVKLLHHPTWLRAKDMDLIDFLTGKIPVDFTLNDTIFVMRILPGTQGNVSAMYIRLNGKVRWSSIENALLGTSQKIPNTQIAEIGFSEFD